MPHLRSYSLHLPFYHTDDNKNLRILYGIRIVRDLISQFCFFFFPIFLYQFTIDTQILEFFRLPNLSTGMLGIALYYLIARVITIIIAIPLGRILHRHGCHRGLLYSFLARSLQLVFLFLSSYEPYYIIGVILAEPIQTQFFWNSYFTILSKNTLKRNLGKDLGVLQFSLQLITTITPAISGMIAFAFGFPTLFLVGLLFCLVGIILTLLFDLPIPQNTVSFKEFFVWLKEREYEQFAFSYPGKYINDSVMFLWPLYVFFFLGTVDRVGFLYTMSLFSAMLFTFFFGNIIDNSSSKKPFFASGGMLSLLWVLRTQVWNVWSIAVVDAFEKLTANFHWLYFDSIFIKRSKGNKALSYFVYSEIINSIVGTIFWALVACLFLLNIGWSALFLLGAIGVLASTFLNERNHALEQQQPRSGV